jgi:hypothetical protein
VYFAVDQSLAKAVAERHNDELVRQLVHEIHKLGGMYDMTLSALDQAKARVQQLELDNATQAATIAELRGQAMRHSNSNTTI